MRLAVVDGNNVARAAYHVSGHLQNSKGQYTGMTLTFLDMMRTMIKTVGDVWSIQVAWDSPNCWRFDLFDEYKSNRIAPPSMKEETGNDWSGQKRMLQMTLPHFGIGQVEVERLEADDIAGLWAKNAWGTKLVFCSNDHDWLQFLRNENAIVYRVRDKAIIDQTRFSAETGCDSIDEYVKMKSITGDPGDFVPGVPGIGPKKALKWLRGEMKAGVSKEKIDEWMEDPNGYERSLRLFQLGVTDPPVPIVTTEHPRNYSEENVRLFLHEAEAASKLNNFDSFISPFRELQRIRNEQDSRSARTDA